MALQQYDFHSESRKVRGHTSFTVYMQVSQNHVSENCTEVVTSFLCAQGSESSRLSCSHTVDIHTRTLVA